MIVKNEAAIIERCLSSLRSHIDYWVIVDTGSTDGTQAIINRLLDGVPGELYSRPWKNFAHNRTEAIQLAERKADYLLFCDADMSVQVLDPLWKNKLHADSYLAIQRCDTGFHYANLRLVNARLTGKQRWRFWGSTHEFCGSVTIGQQSNPVFLDDIEFIDHADGSSRAEKFMRDSSLLECDLAELTNLQRQSDQELFLSEHQLRLDELKYLEPRNTFYLAQTYREMGRLEDSLKMYQRRIELGGWAEEVWYSYFQIAYISEMLELPETTILGCYLKSYEYRPQRVEPLVNLARYYRMQKRYSLAYIFARQAIDIPRPAGDYLFIDGACYDWLNRDEYALAAFWVGNYKESERIYRQLLDGPELPENQRARVRDNLNHALRAQND